MVTSMYVELQPWLTLHLDGTSQVELPREHWIDALDYRELALYVEVATFFTVGSAALTVQTALTDDARAMVPMKNAADQASSFSSIRSPADASFVVPALSASPVRRWVRWVAEASDTTFVCFRITALLRG